MNREQKAAVIDRVAGEIQEADAIFAVDYRGLSVKQAKDLRVSLREADASTSGRQEHAHRARRGPGRRRGPEGAARRPDRVHVRARRRRARRQGDRHFRKAEGLLEWKGGQMNGETLSIDQIEAIARLPAREQLQAQFVGVLASPITGLVRGLGSLIAASLRHWGRSATRAWSAATRRHPSRSRPPRRRLHRRPRRRPRQRRRLRPPRQRQRPPARGRRRHGRRHGRRRGRRSSFRGAGGSGRRGRGRRGRETSESPSEGGDTEQRRARWPPRQRSGSKS